MARVTVEDCIVTIPNRFDLVITAAQRAKQIASGVPLTLDRDNDKDAVVSLREVAKKTVDINLLQEEIVQHFQKRQLPEVHEESRGDSGEASVSQGGMVSASPTGEYTRTTGSTYGGSLSFIEDNIEVED